MTEETASVTTTSGSRSSLKRVSKNVGLELPAIIIATLLLSGLEAAFAGFSRITSSNGGAFRILLSSAIVTTVLVAVSLLVFVFRYRKVIATTSTVEGSERSIELMVKDSVGSSEKNVLGQLKSLESRIPLIDWSYDVAEHESGVYERMLKMVENPRTLEFKIVTIWRDPKPGELSGAQSEAIQRYYSALEWALNNRPDFNYERVVVMRGPLGQHDSAEALFERLIMARRDFIEHCSKVLLRRDTWAQDARGDIKFYGDTGRLVDVAFAVSRDAHRQPLTLVLELGITGPGRIKGESAHPALGLLALDNPNPAVTSAFLLAHQSIRNDTIVDVERLSDDWVKNRLRGVT